MKVLLISHTCQVPNEGQQRAQRLGKLPGIELMVLVPEQWNEYGKYRKSVFPENPSYTFVEQKIRFPWSGPAQWYFHHYPRMAHILRTFRPDIINLWEEPWGFVSAHTTWLRNRVLPSAKIVIETEANIERHHPFPFTSFRRYTHRHADFAVTRQTEGIGVLRAFGYEGPAKFIGNGVDGEMFRPMDRAVCRKAAGVKGFVAGYVGRIIEQKGLMESIEALASCPADVNLLFVGGGVYQPALEARVAELGIGDRVKFVPPQPMDKLPALMNAMDVLLLPSKTTRTWKEQFGRVIIEAQACGTPVIGSDSGGIPEIVDGGGLIVPEGDVNAIAQAMMRLRDTPGLAAELGERGRRQVHQRYTWERIAEQMRDVYLTLKPEPAPAMRQEAIA
jgi:glycosyltransferase involved in cell wall biosynthesis